MGGGDAIAEGDEGVEARKRFSLGLKGLKHAFPRPSRTLLTKGDEHPRGLRMFKVKAYRPSANRNVP